MYRYIFTPYSHKSKTQCPQCKAKNSLVGYVDAETSETLSEEYGKCDREEKCGYHFSPYENPPSKHFSGVKIEMPKEKTHYNILPYKYVEKSLEEQYKDVFSLYLISLFGRKAINVLDEYKVGISNFFGGKSTIFWQIDIDNQVRSGKIFKYEENGKRKKHPYPHITWVHSFLEEDFELKQCFFGEHLLQGNNKEVRVVESEKTALIMACASPEYVWIACTQLQGLGDEKIDVIKDRITTFVPDKGKAFDIWAEKINKKENKNWKVSDFLESIEDMEEGIDIADYYLYKLL